MTQNPAGHSTVRSADVPADEATGPSVAHREPLFRLVHPMLDSATDTEDVLPETCLSWTSRDGGAAHAVTVMDRTPDADRGSGVRIVTGPEKPNRVREEES
ncbi:hypothetical protein [Streptomyces sp. NPDC006012]|uniref:hypothetical protein n=1 Tax=Streptomyces sp. NPDC006012 TaxID=3364739 RepID=UPI0036BBE02C